MSLPQGEALYHMSAKIIQRSKGRSVVAAAAYRAGQALHDERLDRRFDYGRKGGVIGTTILAPADAPSWATDRAELWNRVEQDPRKNAQLAREIELTLPRQLPPESWRGVVESFLAEYVALGAVADIAIHCPRAADGEAQPHAHVLLTTRTLDAESGSGFSRRKNAALAARFESGGRAGGGAWGDALRAERERWANHLNRVLRERGADVRVDHRSYRDRGIDREAEPHIGEQRVARAKRLRKADRRISNVVALRRERRITENLIQMEVAMSKEQSPFSQPKQEVKTRLLRQRIPDLNLSQVELPEDAVYRVLARDSGPLRVQMRDGSWTEYDSQAGRVRFWGGTGTDTQAATLAGAIGEAEGVDDIAHDPLHGASSNRGRKRRPDGQPFPPRRLQEDEAKALADGWRQRGYTDVDESPDGVWVHLGKRTRLQDTGDRLDIHGRADDDAIRALCAKASDWQNVMELYGPEAFKEKAWLEAMRQGVEVVGYTPPESVRETWEAEQASRQEAQGARQALSGATGEAVALRLAARGDAAAARELPEPLRAFVLGYAQSGASRDTLAAIAGAQVSDVVPELERFRWYGQAHMDPAGTRKALADWIDGTGEPPGCLHVAQQLRAAVDSGQDRDEVVSEAMKAIGVTDQDGQLRDAETLRQEREERLRRALEQQQERGHAVEMRHG